MYIIDQSKTLYCDNRRAVFVWNILGKSIIHAKKFPLAEVCLKAYPATCQAH